MIIVTGSVRSRSDDLQQVLALSLEHVQRSRAEPGCISHAVHQHVEDPLTVVFLETWRDRQALAVHFAVPSSQRFVRAVSALAAAPPTIDIYEATAITL